MSRTIRRKNEKFSHWDCPKWKPHSDKFEFNAPKSYRQEFNIEFRAKNKMILINAINGNNEEPMFIPFKKNVNWYYY